MPFQKGHKGFNKGKEIAWAVNENGCWICTSHYKDNDGYPIKWINGRNVRISHIFFEKYKGQIPVGMCVCHTCDTPPCINPDHLWIGTNKENTIDMIMKGRSGFSKLRRKDIIEIRSLNETYRNIAIKYNVSCSRISDIKNKKSWSYII